MSKSQERHVDAHRHVPTGDSPGPAGRSGEGAASAMEQMISQDREQRQQNGQAEPDERTQ